MTVPPDFFARYTARHLRIRHLVQFILADPVYYNALTNCAARLCRALCRVAHMCSRTVSDTANMSRHGSTLCSPTVEKILCRSPTVSALWQADAKRKRGDSQEGWKPWCPSLLCARAASAHVPALRRAQLPRLIQAKNSPPVRNEHAHAVRAPRTVGAEKGLPPGQGVSLTQSVCPGKSRLLKFPF